MLKPEVLEDYLNLSDWKPDDFGIAEVANGICTRCGDREATVSICVPCLLEVAAKMNSSTTPEPMAVMTETAPRRKRRVGILEWSVITLLSLGVLVTGSLLSAAIR